jgi:ribosomal-protein-alanine N-acetyltransferase
MNNKNPFDKVLETPRLLLRRLKESDDQPMFEYTSNPYVTKYLSWYAHTEIIQSQRYIESVIAEYDSPYSYTWAIEIKEFQKFIGIVRIFDVSYGNKRGEISYILNPVFQGKGLIVEAIAAVIDFCFTKIELNRIQAKCTPDNYSSERVMQKLGMKYEGTLKEFWINKGILTDAKIYALTAHNYMEK